MYTVLIIDDEELVRRGLQTRIDWAGEGFELLPPSTKSRLDLEAIKQYRPDVVLAGTDMPLVNGLSSSFWIAEHYPETLLIVVSGYDESEYAQAALTANFFDYVFKPLPPRDLLISLRRLKATLDKRRGDSLYPCI
jgi:two-component system response regulator YesN